MEQIRGELLDPRPIPVGVGTARRLPSEGPVPLRPGARAARNGPAEAEPEGQGDGERPPSGVPAFSQAPKGGRRRGSTGPASLMQTPTSRAGDDPTRHTDDTGRRGGNAFDQSEAMSQVACPTQFEPNAREGGPHPGARLPVERPGVMRAGQAAIARVGSGPFVHRGVQQNLPRSPSSGRPPGGGLNGRRRPKRDNVGGQAQEALGLSHALVVAQEKLLRGAVALRCLVGGVVSVIVARPVEDRRVAAFRPGIGPVAMGLDLPGLGPDRVV